LKKKLEKIGKKWKNWKKFEKHCETLRHWKHWEIFQYIDSETLNSIQCQCWKFQHWKPTQCQCQFFQCFNVSLNVQCRFADPYFTVTNRGNTHFSFFKENYYLLLINVQRKNVDIMLILIKKL